MRKPVKFKKWKEMTDEEKQTYFITVQAWISSTSILVRETTPSSFCTMQSNSSVFLRL